MICPEFLTIGSGKGTLRESLSTMGIICIRTMGGLSGHALFSHMKILRVAEKYILLPYNGMLGMVL